MHDHLDGGVDQLGDSCRSFVLQWSFLASLVGTVASGHAAIWRNWLQNHWAQCRGCQPEKCPYHAQSLDCSIIRAFPPHLLQTKLRIMYIMLNIVNYMQ